MEVRTKKSPTIITGKISLFCKLKFLPWLRRYNATIGRAKRYLKNRTESTDIPSAYNGRAKRGFIPYMAAEDAAKIYPFVLFVIFFLV